MTIIKSFTATARKFLQRKPSAGQNASDYLTEWKQMGFELRQIDEQMKTTIERGVDLTGPDEMINREQYRMLAERKRSLNSQFISMGQLVSALNTESMLEKERETIKRMSEQAARLGDPMDYEAAMDELIIRRNTLDERISAVNKARNDYVAATAAPEIPEDDEYTRNVNAARSRIAAQKAAAATEACLNTRDEMTATEGAILNEEH